MRILVLVLGLGLTTVGGAVQAQTPPAPLPGPAAVVSGVTVTARRATPIAGVTVTASVCPEPNPAKFPAAGPPRVSDSYPAQGAIAPPGVAVIRVTFDAPMSCYWEVSVQSSLDDDPCGPAGRWALPGRTTWTMDCKLAPDARYTIRFGREEGQGFVGLSGQAAQSYRLDFSTSDATPTASLEDASRLDPGPPGAAAKTLAYVVCTALPPRPHADDCRRTTAAATGPR